MNHSHWIISVSTACDSYAIDESVRQALAFTYGAVRGLY